ncbi:hypothetical protein HU200_044363 [Digitaria exilis]|uniref:Uncharacterized protein n=1 Tax=Digitaria exilis TaxID=1010633 RepID=A0A835B2K9_9POAL|nr:hypothetical protein HU200_044363 [Digitaria exilis]
MASPPRGQPATAAAPAATTSPQVPTASHPLPRAFLATSPPRAPAAAATAAPAPPLFTARPLNPSAPAHVSPAPHGILYPVSRPVPPSGAPQLRRVPPMAVGYPRSHVAVPIAQPQQPLAHSQLRSYAALPRNLVAVARPEQPPRGVPIATQSKVNPVHPVAPSGEQGNPKDRERSREDSTIVVINDRKVNLMDSESGSLYALCRSWVRNGVPHESQPSFGNGEPILPRPLPASVVDSRISDKENNDAADVDSDEEPQKVTFINLLCDLAFLFSYKSITC